VIGNFIVGGSSQLVVDIIEGTSDEYEHKIAVFSLSGLVGYQPLDIREFTIKDLRALREWLQDENPELVHIHYFVRDSDKYEEGALWYETVFRICEDIALKVVQNVNIPTHPNASSSVVHNVFVSHYVERNFNNSPAPFSVIYPGSDFSHFKNDDIDSLPPKAIGMVYRLDNDKLRSDAIEVFIQVARRDPEITAYIVGGGFFLEGFIRRVREEKLQDRITLTGFVPYDKLPAMYRQFSIFIAPVHDESFGQVTPFAMGMGMSVAGYNTGAIGEILASDETLAQTGDVDGLAEIIVDLANDSRRRKKLGAANHERAFKKFSVDQMVQEYRDLYTSLLSK